MKNQYRIYAIMCRFCNLADSAGKWAALTLPTMKSKRLTFALSSGLGILAILAATAAARTGPGSSETPYLVPESGDVDFTSVLTVGDTAESQEDDGSYPLAGMPDGMGAYDNDDGTLTLLVSHGLTAGSGAAPEPGARGDFVSAWR